MPSAATAERAEHDRAPEAERAAEPVGQRVRDIGAQHVEGAMGEIDDAGYAENDREAGSDEKQRASAREPRDELDKIEAQGRAPPPERCAGRRSPRPWCASRRASVLRAQRLDLRVGGKIGGAVAVGHVDHDALAVLERGLADEGAERGLMVDRPECDRPERRVDARCPRRRRPASRCRSTWPWRGSPRRF